MFMQTKKQFITGLIALIAIAFEVISCGNTYNSLIPNNEENILEFSLFSEDYKARSVSSEISENYITVKVKKGTDITKLYPKAELPKQATLFPLTLKYFQEAFPHTDILDMALRINPAKKALENWFLDLYEETPDFNIPPLVFPINFLYPVTFAVIGGQGGVEIYTVKVVYEDGSAPSVEDLPDPSSDESKKILSFYVPDKQKGTSLITHNTIDFTLKAGTDLRDILPEITAENNAVAIPLTKEYLFEVSTKLGLDPLSVAQGFIDASDKAAFIRGALATADTSNLTLAIDKQIDFTNPIKIVVLGTLDKTVRVYTATANLDQDDVFLKTLAFTKANNPALIKDYLAEISQEYKKATCTVYYPVEYRVRDGIYHLKLDAQYTGSKLTIEYNGRKYFLNREIPFKPIKTSGELYLLGTASAKIHIENNGAKKTYALKLNFKEDPDTIRSITDFRFEKYWNEKIKATSIASITHLDEIGTIKATVLYSGEKPSNLKPSIITGGGSVLVRGVSQSVNGSSPSKQDFSNPIDYVCVSKVGNYERVYTVTIEFVKVETPEVVLKSFKFSQHLNKELVQDAIGVIDESHATVNVEALYDDVSEPLELVSEFSATGKVSIDGITQTSGFSTQNYKYDVYLKVTALDDENVSKTYRVHVSYKYSKENRVQLLRFYLERGKNPTLSEDIECYISSSSYNVYALVPKTCELTQLVPSFEAEGIVKVSGVVQTSGNTSQDFTNIVDYEVVSENGQNSKTYKVKIQRQGNIIYLDPNARGRNDGSTWKDAFRKLEDAIWAANEASEAVEIWATDDEFVNVKAYVRNVCSIGGGFKGEETSKEERKKRDRTRFNNVRFYSGGATGALVFDGIEFYGNINLFKDGYYEFSWNSEKFRENSITFENCHVEGIPMNIKFGDIQRLKIKDSYFGKSVNIYTYFNLPEGFSEDTLFSELGLEMEIEDSEFLSNIRFMYVDFARKITKLSLLKVKDSMLSGEFMMYANNVEFENVREYEPNTRVTLVNVGEKGVFKNVSVSKLNIDSSYIKEYGSFLFIDAKIEELVFSAGNYYSQGEKVAGELEFRGFQSIDNVKIGTPESFAFNKLTIGEWYNSYVSCKMLLKAKDIKIKNVGLVGNITIFGCENGNVEVNNVNIKNLDIRGSKDGVSTIKYSRFNKLAVAGGKEIFLSNLAIKEKLICGDNGEKVTASLDRIEGDEGAILDCRLNNINASTIWKFKEVLLYGKENVNLTEFYIRPELDKLSVVGNNVRMKETFVGKSKALIEIVALKFFDFDCNLLTEESEFFKDVKVALYHPTNRYINGQTFNVNLKLLNEFYYDDSLKFSDSLDCLTFTNCIFNGNLEVERYGVIIDSCKFGMPKYGDAKLKVSFINRKENTSIVLGMKNIKRTERYGSLEIEAGKGSYIRLSDSNLSDVTFSGEGIVGVSSSHFSDCPEFSSSYNADFFINGCVFEIDGSLLETDIWFKGKNVNIIDSTFEKKYEYATYSRCRVLLDVVNLMLKGSKFKDVGYMCHTSIRAHRRKNKVTIEDCSFENACSIHVKSYDTLLVKNSYLYGITFSIVVDATDVNNHTSSSKTIFENCDFHNRWCGINISNYYVDGYYGPVAIKFEYDLNNLPSNLRSAILGTPTHGKVASVLRNIIESGNSSKERVGYFLNLGNATPSNSHSSKFLGNYY